MTGLMIPYLVADEEEACILFFSIDVFFFIFFKRLFFELIIETRASPSGYLISLIYSMPAYSGNSFGLFKARDFSCKWFFNWVVRSFIIMNIICLIC